MNISESKKVDTTNIMQNIKAVNIEINMNIPM
jgi:hypothetical protein